MEEEKKNMVDNKLPSKYDKIDHDKYSEADRAECYENCLNCCGRCQGFISTWICCCCESPYKKIYEGEFGIIMQLGRFNKVVPPGLQYVNPLTHKLHRIDKRERTVDLRRQALLTRDNVTIIIDAVVYWKIMDPYKSTFLIDNLDEAIREMSKTTLKEVMGNVLLQEAFEKREVLSKKIRDIIDRPTDAWGVHVTRVLVQEILLAKDTQDSLSSAAIAKRTAEGKIIYAQAEVDSAKLMREASDILDYPAAMQIRYLDYITDLASSRNCKVVLMPASSNKDSSADIKALRKFLVQNEI